MGSTNALTRLDRRTLLAVAGAVAFALLTTGCGEGAIGALSVSKQEFIRQAELICNKADADQPGEFEEFTAANKEALDKLAPIPYEETVATDYIIPSVKGQIRELEALDRPEEGRKELDAILHRFNVAVREGEKDPYSIANFWVPAQDPLAKVNKAAARYGFEACAELR